MKLKLVFLGALITILFLSCEKDKFTTIPQIKVKSISPGTVDIGNIINMETEFTDEEGDLDSVYIVMKWFDGAVPNRVFDTIRYSFASYNLPAKTREGDIFVKFSYGQQIQGYTQLTPSPAPLYDTTASFGILVVDKARNRSEYKESDKIRLLE